MFEFSQIDPMVRGGSLALLALLSWALLRDHRQAVSARVALLMILSIACHIAASTVGTLRNATPIELLAVLGALSVPGCFWLFAKSWFNDAARVGLKNWAILAAVTLLMALQLGQFRLGYEPPFAEQAALRITMIGFGVAGLWEAWRGRNDDLVETRRGFRRALIWIVGSYVLLTNATEILISYRVLSASAHAVVEYGILLLCFGFCAAMLGVKEASLFVVSRPAETVPPVQLDDAFAERLHTYMKNELAWRDENLSISALAARLGEQEYRLRRLINGQLGYRNFSAFLSSYRLAEVKQALADPAQRDVPIITIALDAGFGSLGPFNRAFREAEGMTPSEYRVQAR